MTYSRKETLADGVELFLGDCRDILPGLPKVDAVVTDPPYGIGYQHSGGGRAVPATHPGRPLSRNTDAIIGDDQPFDPALFLHWPCMFFGASHFSARLPHGTFHVWDKHCGSASDDNFSDVEFVWSSKRTKSHIFRHLWKGILRDSENTSPRWHPSQKPIAVMEWCIKLLADEPRTILDPFMGSGTTGVAAVKLGRRFIGVEIEPRYFDISLRRVSEALKQPDLFIEKPKPPTQEKLSL